MITKFTGPHIWLQVHQKDNRIENYHLYLTDQSMIDEFLSELKPICKSLTPITKKHFEWNAPLDILKVNIHRDLYGPEDGKVEYVEHYEVKK